MILAAIAATVATVLAGCSSAAESSRSATQGEYPAPIQQTIDCLEDAGFPGFTSEDGGFRSPPGIGEEQFEPMRAAVEDCQIQAGFYLDGIPEAERSRLYDLELASSECLTDAGYPPQSIPSLQSYLDSFETQPWSAFEDAFFTLPESEVTEELYGELLAQCPRPIDTFVKQ